MSIFSKQFEEEIAHLNSLLTDSHITTCALFQLLDSNGINVGSTELIQAREKVEAKVEAKVKRLERELAEAKRDAARYEVVRKMNAADFSKLFQRCITEDLRFDDEVDKIGGLK